MDAEEEDVEGEAGGGEEQERWDLRSEGGEELPERGRVDGVNGVPDEFVSQERGCAWWEGRGSGRVRAEAPFAVEEKEGAEAENEAEEEGG